MRRFTSFALGFGIGLVMFTPTLLPLFDQPSTIKYVTVAKNAVEYRVEYRV